MILHLSHIFLTEARTFMTKPPKQLLVAVCNTTAIEVVRRKLYQHSVSGKDADKMLTHLSRDMRKHLVLALFQLDPEHGVRQGLKDLCHDFYSFFLFPISFFFKIPSPHKKNKITQ